jgi:hypothetical protein
MSTTFQDLFTPIFIFTALCIFIAGIVGLQFLDRLFYGSKNLMAIRLFAITIILNVIILIFLIMSFSKVKFSVGKMGPQGNKGERGYDGPPGGINICITKPQIVQEKKARERAKNYLDTKPPFLEDIE